MREGVYGLSDVLNNERHVGGEGQGDLACEGGRAGEEVQVSVQQ